MQRITSERASILGCPTPSNPAAAVARRERQAQAHVCRLGARSLIPLTHVVGRSLTTERRQSIVHVLITEYRLSQRKLAKLRNWLAQRSDACMWSVMTLVNDFIQKISCI